jgi:hypothetical protein
VPAWLWIVVAALVVAAISAGVTFLVVGGDEEAAPPASTIVADGDEESTTSSTTTTTTTTTASTTTTTTVAGPLDEWVVVLASVESSDGPTAVQERLSQLRSVAPDARTLVSDDYASLRPGYTVIYLPGPTSGAAAVAHCGQLGLSVPNQCYGRYLSQDPADQDQVAVR